MTGRSKGPGRLQLRRESEELGRRGGGGGGGGGELFLALGTLCDLHIMNRMTLTIPSRMSFTWILVFTRFTPLTDCYS